MNERRFNVLFVCTGNSARSILAESILRKDGAGRFNAFSAGSHPRDQVNPHALLTLRQHHYPTDGLRPKSWTEYEGIAAPVMDFVITVCDSAGGETCPNWPGAPLTTRWSIRDPAKGGVANEGLPRAFTLTLIYLKSRIDAFMALPGEKLEKSALASALQLIEPANKHGL